MNVEYALNGDKVLVSNNKGHLEEREYTDNIDEILTEENVLEKINQQINEQEDRGANISYPKYNVKLAIPAAICYIIVPYFLAGLSLLMGETIGTIPTFLGNISTPVFMSMCLGIPAIGTILGFHIKGKHDKKKYRENMKAVDSTLNFLEEKKEVVEKHLEELKAKANSNCSNNNNNNMSNKPIIIHDIDRIWEIDNYVLIHNILGKNFSKYYKAYKKGKLRDLLGGYDYETNRQIYIDYIEQYGPRLVKNFKVNDLYKRR